MLGRSFLLLLVACQGESTSSKVPVRPAIEVRDPAGVVVARVVGGHPCRATIEGHELIVGGRPLVAQYGSARWTGQDAANGVTLAKNDQPVARIHAKQLFDAEGVPLLRVMDNGDVASGAGRIVRKIVRTPDGSLSIVPNEAGGDTLTVSGMPSTPDDIALAAMLTAHEASPEVRALAACHYLLHDETKG
ncbi:MAG TPA: hypothetical protein VFQ53_23370 [Kofleriaceae bacterium]|nr:hypothetical protein [Kofleriaceae bacterium]